MFPISKRNYIHHQLSNLQGLLLNWKKTKEKKLIDSLKIPLAITFAITLITAFIGGFADIMAILFLFTAYFTLVINSSLAFKIIKGNVSFVGVVSPGSNVRTLLVL